MSRESPSSDASHSTPPVLPAPSGPYDRTDRDPLVGETIDGNYRVTAVLHEGRYANVYEAHDHAADARRALKLVRAEWRDTSHVIDSMECTIAIATNIRHQKLVGLHATGVCGERKYVVMDRLVGVTLAALVDNGRRQALVRRPTEALRHAYNVACALEHLHSQGVIHNNVTPTNIFVDHRQGGMLHDFDEAYAPGFVSARRLPRYDVHGFRAPGYGHALPPNVLSDVFGLGAALYYVFTGRTPYGAVGMGDLAESVMLGYARRLPDHSGLPEDVVVLINRAVHPIPQERHATMADLCVDLARAIAVHDERRT